MTSMTSAVLRGVAAVPLAHQPGTACEYCLASDILGRVVEKTSGQASGPIRAYRRKPFKQMVQQAVTDSRQAEDTRTAQAAD